MVIPPENEQHHGKQQLCESNETNGTCSKRFRDSSTPTSSLNYNENTSQNKDVEVPKAGLTSLENCIKQLTLSITTMSAKLEQNSEKLEQHTAEMKQNMEKLTAQIHDLQTRDKEKSKQIEQLNQKIEQLEQKSINKNIEISNISNINVNVDDIIKEIVLKTGVQISNNDIERAYKIPKKKKLIIEFSTLNKKRELMSKIKRHSLQISNGNGESNENGEMRVNESNTIYLNDELTPHNRRLLWLTKTKARECGWKFVWVRNGVIYARRIENSPFILISNSSDIENITCAN
ncbi:uncharacterized protein LOC101895692 [Musca domestica]|uniref:Uncharacterized protein LOC101895692 n=1 Tax=Musca domestica TaxID=7370 RepID=A0A1I8N143_MUSDO|nr:uncharacterized protein LOC101895692 [Musca domestica]